MQLSIVRPEGKKILQFAVVLKDEIGAFAKVVETISKHNVDIRSASVGNLTSTADFVATFFLEFERSMISAENLADAIRKHSFVKVVRYSSSDDRLFDGFIFPVSIGNGHRIILMRTEPLLNIERSLISKFGSAGGTIMFEEGKAYADNVFDQYMAALPNLDKEQLLENLKDGLRATGWGLFEVSRQKQGFVVTVNDPPLLTDTDYLENRFYYGVGCRVLERLYSVKLRLAGSELDKSKRKLVFNLVYDTS